MVDAVRSRSIERSPGTRTASTPVAVSDARNRSKKALARSSKSEAPHRRGVDHHEQIALRAGLVGVVGTGHRPSHRGTHEPAGQDLDRARQSRSLRAAERPDQCAIGRRLLDPVDDVPRLVAVERAPDDLRHRPSALLVRLLRVPRDVWGRNDP